MRVILGSFVCRPNMRLTIIFLSSIFCHPSSVVNSGSSTDRAKDDFVGCDVDPLQGLKRCVLKKSLRVNTKRFIRSGESGDLECDLG